MVEHALKDSKVEMAEHVFQRGGRGKERGEGEMGLILNPTHS